MTWMRQRNWREKVAKSRSGQSLYEHSLIELDVLLQIGPMLRDRKHYGLSELEERVLIVSLIVHDAGKELDEWQAYVRSAATRPWVPHIVPQLSETLVPGICAELGFEDLSADVHRVIAHCAGMHHDRPGNSNAAVIESMLIGSLDRFVTLAHLVKAIDHLCSADSPSDAVAAGQSDAQLQKHLKFTAHDLIPRGVSTTLLHRAAQTAFEQAGWTPLVYFVNGTVYASDLNSPAALPSAESICAVLKSEIEAALRRDMSALMVGSPTGNILPKPELLSFDEVAEYLSAAGQKIGRQSFAKKKPADRRKVIENYYKLKGRSERPNDVDVDHESGRISVAQPEMLVFKFFKALMDPNKIPMIGEEEKKIAQQNYEAIFGGGSWDLLQCTSTLMAARDMANTVDRYWELAGATVGHPERSKVEEIPDQTRLETLVSILSKLARSVFESTRKPSPRDAVAGAMAQSFTADLITPGENEDVRTSAADQLLHYRQSKPNAGKEAASAAYLCPICSKPFDSQSGLKASADFIDNPQTHTNRGTSHGAFGYLMVCTTCYHERILRQLLMGQPVAEIIALSPRLNLGPSNGNLLLEKIRELTDTANTTKGAAFGISMGLTDQIARQAQRQDPFALEPEELVALFRFRYTAETQRKRKKQALELLMEEFDELGSLNAACSGSFSGWDEAVQALVDNKIDQQECRAIRRQVFGRSDVVQLTPQTPNLIFVPLRHEIASSSDESESNKALRRLYVALLLSIVFDASVSIGRPAEIAELTASEGAAYVPAVPAIRSLIQKQWIKISQARYWLNAIGAASVLARDAALSPRSALYQALSADPAEKLLRRIDEKGHTVTPQQLAFISQLPGFHATQSQASRP